MNGVRVRPSICYLLQGSLGAQGPCVPFMVPCVVGESEWEGRQGHNPHFPEERRVVEGQYTMWNKDRSLLLLARVMTLVRARSGPSLSRSRLTTDALCCQHTGTGT